MENHDFSEPTPFPEGPIQPCWKVDVYRRGVEEPVACLEIHAQNLPPRKASKKNKVLWKLPDSIEDTPRFGGLEKERLWELFKLEKKNRRRSKSNNPNKSDQKGDGEEEYGDSSSDLIKEGTQKSSINTTANAKVGSSNGGAEKSTSPRNAGNADDSRQGTADASINQQEDRIASMNRATETTTPSPVPPPPPPGFGGSPRDSSSSGIGTTPPKLSPPASSTANGKYLSSRPAMDQRKSSVPPPPGMTVPNGVGEETIPQNQNTTADPPPAASSPSSMQSLRSVPSLPSCFVFGSLTSRDILTMPPDLLSNIIGNHVAQVLIQSLTTPEKLPVWLARYHANAQKLLLFGTAQALARTAADRQQQWESLIFSSVVASSSPTSSAGAADANNNGATPLTTSMAPWDCQGWAVQTMPCCNSHNISSTPDHNNGTHDNKPKESMEESPSLLVVLTGRTVQKQEILTYHLTLTLCVVVSGPPTELLPGTPYQICNEILSLARAVA